MKRSLQIEIPGYRIERVLGKGGMATVYLATQMSLGRPVALKVLHDPETPQFFERFLNEGRCIARLNHSNLIAIYDIGQGDGFYYIAMEYLAGGDLKSRMVQGIKPERAIRILIQLAGCLSYVHNEGVIHRDIKPSNILFRNDGTPVLTDFGIAKLIQADNDLTVTGTVMGSPHYLSPELAQGHRRVDGRSDLYALGIILHEMLTGRKPYTADSFAATLMAHIQKPLPQLPQQYAELQPILDRLLAKKPEDRFQNGAELVMNLQPLRNRFRRSAVTAPKAATAAAGSETRALEPPGRGTPGNLRRLAYAVMMAVVLGGLATYYRSKDTPPVEAGETAPIASQQIPMDPDPPRIEPENSADPARDAPEQQPIPATTEGQTSPPDTPDPAPSDAMDNLLQRANQRLASDRLSYPVNDSARHYFNAILQQDPGNRAARRGLDRVADRYADLAQSQLQRGRRMKARRLAAQGLEVRPQNERLIRIMNRLNAPIPAKQPKDIFDYLTPDNDR
ncbi:MAG: protein kinase [Sedimenticola sp.]|nr:protein kinase [Sedimenticola sp.]